MTVSLVLCAGPTGLAMAVQASRAGGGGVQPASPIRGPPIANAAATARARFTHRLTQEFLRVVAVLGDASRGDPVEEGLPVVPSSGSLRPGAGAKLRVALFNGVERFDRASFEVYQAVICSR